MLSEDTIHDLFFAVRFVLVVADHRYYIANVLFPDERKKQAKEDRR